MILEVWVSDKLRVPFEREFARFFERMAARRESRGFEVAPGEAALVSVR